MKRAATSSATDRQLRQLRREAMPQKSQAFIGLDGHLNVCGACGERPWRAGGRAAHPPDFLNDFPALLQARAASWCAATLARVPTTPSAVVMVRQVHDQVHDQLVPVHAQSRCSAPPLPTESAGGSSNAE